MHRGGLTSNGATARVYRVLRSRPNQWVSGPELARAAAIDPDWPLTAVSTRIAEVRNHPGLPLGEQVESAQRGKGFYYRLRVHVEAEQLALY